MAIAVGLRRGEALGLSWNDLDLDRRTLTVRQTLQRLKGKLVLGPTKTKKSARMVSLPAFSVLRSVGTKRSRMRSGYSRAVTGSRMDSFSQLGRERRLNRGTHFGIFNACSRSSTYHVTGCII